MSKGQKQITVIPAEAGIQGVRALWIPAFAGMTAKSESAPQLPRDDLELRHQ